MRLFKEANFNCSNIIKEYLWKSSVLVKFEAWQESIQVCFDSVQRPWTQPLIFKKWKKRMYIYIYIYNIYILNNNQYTKTQPIFSEKYYNFLTRYVLLPLSAWVWVLLSFPRTSNWGFYHLMMKAIMPK